MTVPNNNTPLTAFELAAAAANFAEDKKASNTAMLETGQVSCLADYFIITSGSSQTQIKAISEAIVAGLSSLGISPSGIEQDQGNRWHLIDYGDVVIHIMHEEEREFYQLELFWNHARVIERNQWEALQKQAS